MPVSVSALYEAPVSKRLSLYEHVYVAGGMHGFQSRSLYYVAFITNVHFLWVDNVSHHLEVVTGRSCMSIFEITYLPHLSPLPHSHVVWMSFIRRS